MTARRADFDGDRQAEIPISSPWGLGILKWVRGALTSPTMQPNGSRFGRGWLLNTADNQVGIDDQLIRLHVKILTNPTIPVEEMIVAMRQVFEAVGVRVHRVSTETLNLPLLNDLDVGTCTLGVTTTAQNQLFNNRNNAGPNDVVVYFVRSTVPPFNGCAAFPAGRARGCRHPGRHPLDPGPRGGPCAGAAARRRPAPAGPGCPARPAGPADDRARHRQHHQSAA